MNATRISMALGLIAVLATACGSGPQNSGDDDEVYMRTIAQINPDGTVAWTRMEPVTASQQREDKQHVLRSRAAKLNVPGPSGSSPHILTVNSDSSCASADDWLFSNNNYTGNELCLYGTSPFTTCGFLGNFAYPGGGNWEFKQLSYWTGSRKNGLLLGRRRVCPSSGTWGTYTQYSDTCTTASASICFTN